jgi:hypothetical protein
MTRHAMIAALRGCHGYVVLKRFCGALAPTMGAFSFAVLDMPVTTSLGIHPYLRRTRQFSRNGQSQD